MRLQLLSPLMCEITFNLAVEKQTECSIEGQIVIITIRVQKTVSTLHCIMNSSVESTLKYIIQ